ncbi:phosphoethanolamine transferase domain-containing protein, partial [Vibrio parahaemolyticus]|uniref:phosphoethanolamine transferase domain-containing protein n=1 Tax=Vibrio parahaemolyticus TaxID=670 RepID=UPI00235F0B62
MTTEAVNPPASFSISSLREKYKISMTAFLAIMSLYFGFVLNTPVTSKLIELTKGSESHLFSYTSPLLLSFAFFIIFSAFGFTFVFRPIFILFTISSAAACYATNTYQVIFDYGMI